MSDETMNATRIATWNAIWDSMMNKLSHVE